jgi:hypothetical protein
MFTGTQLQFIHRIIIHHQEEGPDQGQCLLTCWNLTTIAGALPQQLLSPQQLRTAKYLNTGTRALCCCAEMCCLLRFCISSPVQPDGMLFLQGSWNWQWGCRWRIRLPSRKPMVDWTSDKYVPCISLSLIVQLLPEHVHSIRLPQL